MKENFMARALNKNKKPKSKNKNRACNYFLGSFGSPCGFCDSPHTRFLYLYLYLYLYL